MSISAATYIEAGTTLRALETFFTNAATWAGDTATALETKTNEIGETWFGPYPTQHGEQATAYLTAVKPLGDCCTSAASTIGAWAAVAEQFAIDVAGYETTITSLSRAPFVPEEVHDQISAARANKADTARAWQRQCQSSADTLSSAITTVRNCASATAVPVEQRAVAPGGSYTVLTVALTHIADVPLSWVDPSGDLQKQADEALESFLASGDSDLMYTVMETADQDNILRSNDNLSRSDLEAATDPERVRGLLLAWGRATGTTFGEDDLATMTASIVATAWMILGSDKEDWKDIDDTLEPEAELTSVLGDQAVEAFVNAGSSNLIGPNGEMPTDPVEAFVWAGGGAPMPSSVDEAIETGNLNLYVNGPTPISSSDWDTPGDWFRNVVFDWEAFYGEDASFGSAAFQVLGVLPVGRGLQTLRVLRWADETAELTGDAARFWNGLGLGDEAIAAIDSHTFDGVVTLGDDVGETAFTVGGQHYDANFSAQTVVDSSGATGRQVVEQALDESAVFDDLGVEPWTVDEALTAINTPPSQLTSEQATVLQHLREEVGLPEEGDLLQRFVPYGESELVLENIDSAHPNSIRGFIAPAQDAALTAPSRPVRRRVREHERANPVG